ncbi:hypothetical protein VM1G_11364 [Cytospora mali]|uniref:Uncharacterized protein n=1 Tax=Cytospora mali TaxID=578113 RepID=A0A194VQG4_CYTMA|nr:hypothetical protein VM1G_11364 [Valsa mali]
MSISDPVYRGAGSRVPENDDDDSDPIATLGKCSERFQRGISACKRLEASHMLKLCCWRWVELSEGAKANSSSSIIGAPYRFGRVVKTKMTMWLGKALFRQDNVGMDLGFCRYG